MPKDRKQDTFHLTLGVEEEFLIVDPASGDVLTDPDPRLFAYCEKHAPPHRMVHEFLRSQIESNTRVCASVSDLREAISETRRIILDAADSVGAAVIATSTHPFASWESQMPTPRERYERFAITFQETVRRALVGGMHVHAGFGDPDSRVRVMTAIRQYLPLLHALSTSSPFSEGRETGFKSYRLSIMGALPRTSLPRAFASHAEYESLVSEYQRLSFISNASELWWDIRPSNHYPTVELRICDVCTRVSEALAVVALYACLLRWLFEQDAKGALPEEPPTEIIAENRWLAQRYGVLGFYGDIESGGRKDIDDEARLLVEQLGEHARELDCESELLQVLDIIRDGTSADRQVDHYRLRRLEGDSEEQALRSVVQVAIRETGEGL